MNILYLIGNGFDLNLGMRTKYEHFYEDYIMRFGNTDKLYIKKFIKAIVSDDKQKWSDFEYALGQYLGCVERDDAVELHDHLIKQLSMYIAQQENLHTIDSKYAERFYDYLKNPYSNRLLPNEIKNMDKYMSLWKNVDWAIRVITFNYTKSIERITGDTGATPIQIGSHHTGSNIVLQSIEHVHGFTDKRMILGVNDISQIANEALRKETIVTDSFVKSECNSTYGLEHADKCKGWIRSANLICLFGLSFGETDKVWWEEVGTSLSKGTKVILFEYNPEEIFNGNQGPKLKATKDTAKDNLLSKTHFNDEIKTKLKNSIHVAYNSNMFRFDSILT